jgi:hypothetical protein
MYGTEITRDFIQRNMIKNVMSLLHRKEFLFFSLKCKLPTENKKKNTYTFFFKYNERKKRIPFIFCSMLIFIEEENKQTTK